MAGNYKNIDVEDTIVQKTISQVNETASSRKESLYKTMLSNGVFGDNSGRVYSDDTLAIVFNYNTKFNGVGKYWAACEGKIYGTHYSAGTETGDVYQFDMAAANSEGDFTATKKYDFSSTRTFTFTAGPATDSSYTIYMEASADFKAFGYFYDLLNIKSIDFTLIDND